jgi:tRNA modification GTPase
MDDGRPIAAIATAGGRGAIGVVRVSGRDVGAVVQGVIGRALEPRRATLVAFLDAQGEPIDRGIALLFPGPASYTGEDVLELQGHGGPVVLRQLLARVVEAGQSIGIRLAEPGEFTERAFLNGKLDLAQAEAVADLIDAGSERAARAAVRSLDGAFSRTVSVLAGSVLELRVLVEATLDFPEEELDFLQAAQARERLGQCLERLAEVRVQARRGVILSEGLTVVLVGEPNVGKSSLLNALAGADVAIVTAVPGTTRDRIEKSIAIDGVAIDMIDTAGLRQTEDEVERIGIERSWQAVTRADLVLHLIDPRALDTDAVRTIEAGITDRIGHTVPVLRVFNKIDLLDAESRSALAVQDAVAISARTGEGLAALRARLLALAGGEVGAETAFTARARHVEALDHASAHLEAGAAILSEGAQMLELVAEELRLAHDALSRITGRVSADQLLGEIFGRFCIGK